MSIDLAPGAAEYSVFQHNSCSSQEDLNSVGVGFASTSEREQKAHDDRRNKQCTLHTEEVGNRARAAESGPTIG